MNEDLNKYISDLNHQELERSLAKRKTLSYGMQHFYLMKALRYNNEVAFKLMFNRFNETKVSDYGILLSTAASKKLIKSTDIIAKSASRNERIFSVAFIDALYHFINVRDLAGLSSLIRSLGRLGKNTEEYLEKWKKELINIDILSFSVMKYFRRLGVSVTFDVKDQRQFLRSPMLGNKKFVELFKGAYLDERLAFSLTDSTFVSNRIHQLLSRKTNLSNKELIFFLYAEMQREDEKSFIKKFKKDKYIINHSEELLRYYLKSSNVTPMDLIDIANEKTKMLLILIISEELDAQIEK